LTVDALARGADEDAELFLRNMHFRSEIGRQRHQPRASRTGSGCSMDSSIRSLCQRMRWHNSVMILMATLGSRSRKARKILAPQHEQFGRFAGGGVRGAALAVHDRDLAEQVAGTHEIQGQAAAVGGAGLDPDLAAADPVKRVAGVALLEQHLAEPELLGMAEAGHPL
jgi:hypothetical protein